MPISCSGDTHADSNEPTSASAGQALTSAPTIHARCRAPSWRRPQPRCQRPGSRPPDVVRGRFRRLASNTTMEAAQISPSTVNGSSRATTPDSPYERTNS